MNLKIIISCHRTADALCSQVTWMCLQASETYGQRSPRKNELLNSAYYGVIDLTGQYIELKSAEDWQELRETFSSVVQWQSIQTPEHFAQYFDKHCTLPSEPKEDLKAFHVAIEFL